MATVVIMPKQGQSVESCILTEFKKKKGDTVAVGDILFAYETDKASFEEEAQVAGTVLDVFFDNGDEIPVLTNVMVIGNEGESTDEFRPGDAAPAAEEAPAAAAPAPAAAAAPAPAAKAAPAAAPAQSGTTSPVSPRAKALAAKEAVDAASLTGSGPHGRVIERDVKAAVEAAPKTTPLAKAIIKETGAPLPETGSGLAGKAKGADVGALKNTVYATDCEIKPLSNMRKIIAKAMHASLQNSAQLTHHLSADARRIMALRKKVKKAVENGYPTNITLNDMVCLAVIRALQKFPQVNAHFLGDSTRNFSKVHLGLAVDTERGLMVPVVKNADDLSIQGLANQLKEVANACKKGSIDPDLLSSEAASFTVSNLGNYGVEIFTPVINLPQVAILGVNTIVPRPKDLGGGVYGFVPHIGLSLTYDHRALDGGEATRFVKQIATEIETLDFEL
ncbi:dihydrolipoamide acetyltransferase family protein [uncultured Alistipes sp.]|uniref:dihydrolipoamide acetyltransferase family protein n=1 Tax=uncultured Alistipes sp. TaxID=538949 RepID=UPI0026278E49|nr:dihydrolipoamide acetyltransferase family protein [uncultured Alistipes sp.]